MRLEQPFDIVVVSESNVSRSYQDYGEVCPDLVSSIE
jgi:hypothetical protein